MEFVTRVLVIDVVNEWLKDNLFWHNFVSNMAMLLDLARNEVGSLWCQQQKMPIHHVYIGALWKHPMQEYQVSEN